MRKLSVLAAAAILLAYASFAGAQVPEPPPLPVPESAVACDAPFDHDGDPNTPDGNYCDCGAAPEPPAGPEDVNGCVALGPICLAGDPDESGCLAVTGVVAACLLGTDPDPSSLAIPCTEDACAAAASGGCD